MLKRELKIDSLIRPVASGVWYEEASAGRYDLTIYAFGVTLPHVADDWGNGMKTGGGYNFIPYSHPEFDAIVTATARESDPVKLKALTLLLDSGGLMLPRAQEASLIFKAIEQ